MPYILILLASFDKRSGGLGVRGQALVFSGCNVTGSSLLKTEVSLPETRLLVVASVEYFNQFPTWFLDREAIFDRHSGALLALNPQGDGSRRRSDCGVRRTGNFASKPPGSLLPPCNRDYSFSDEVELRVRCVVWLSRRRHFLYESVKVLTVVRF